VQSGVAIEVLLVEDNDLFREALEVMLDLEPDIRVVGSVGDGRSAVAFCAEEQPDVVLMDYRLPELDGVEATAAIRACSDTAIVVLTAGAEHGERKALLDAGAASFLTKDSELEEIVGALRAAAGRSASLV
jgi:DNA-binding NarL/FixJ family response regulator